MADPDADRPTEIDLEMDQRARLMELFSFVETFDGRQALWGCGFVLWVLGLGDLDRFI